MSKKKKVIIGVMAVVILAVIAVGAFCIFYRGNTYGITHGTYAPIDENGKIREVVLEYMWQISKGKAEYSYCIGDLIEENGKIYYYFDRSVAIDKYEMIYDKKTKILTVYMPENYSNESEIKPMKFKRKTLFN